MGIRPGNSRDVRDSPLLGECRGASVSAATPHDELVASTPRAISSCLGERSLGEHIPWIPLDRIQASHPCERYYQARQPPPQRGADSLPTRRLCGASECVQYPRHPLPDLQYRSRPPRLCPRADRVPDAPSPAAVCAATSKLSCNFPVLTPFASLGHWLRSSDW